MRLFLIAIIGILLGALSSFFYQMRISQVNLLKNSDDNPSLQTISPTPVNEDVWVEKDLFAASSSAIPSSQNYQNNSSGANLSKFTILEEEKIKADKTYAETGETVNFSVTLKNIGSKKKFLTHICFNYTGGSFGCLRNHNLLPGEKIVLNNSMMFPLPGKYTVWVTWSQDGNNFYRPLNSNVVNITIR